MNMQSKFFTLAGAISRRRTYEHTKDEEKMINNRSALIQSMAVGLLAGLGALAAPSVDLGLDDFGIRPLGEKDGCKAKDGCKGKDGCGGTGGKKGDKS